MCLPWIADRILVAQRGINGGVKVSHLAGQKCTGYISFMIPFEKPRVIGFELKGFQLCLHFFEGLLVLIDSG